jgi:dTDP-4-amino-4,6-dideoxygalactose transaminase
MHFMSSWRRFKIPIAKPEVTSDDVASVVEALEKGNLSSGEYVERFEKAFASFVGARHAVAVNSGTAALQVALKTMGVGQGDEVITTSFSFAATSNAIVLAGARPVYVDIEEDTYNVDPRLTEKAITRKTKAIMPIHYGGQCCEVDEIKELAEKHDLRFIEDAAANAGSLYKGKRAGSLGDAAGFSFFPDKNMTTGEGGMLTTNDAEVAERARYLRKNGATTRYYHVDIGWNFKMPDFCAALGLSQLKRLDGTISRKDKVALMYSETLASIPKVKPPTVLNHNKHTWMLFAIRVTKSRRDKLMKNLAAKGIETRINWPPIHLQPAYVRLFGFERGILPRTEKAGDDIVSLPIYPSMSREEVGLVTTAISEEMRDS